MAERYRLLLTAEEQAQLRGIITKKKAPAERVVRAQTLLAVAENGLNKDAVEVAALQGVSTKSIERLEQALL